MIRDGAAKPRRPLLAAATVLRIQRPVKPRLGRRRHARARRRRRPADEQAARRQQGGSRDRADGAAAARAPDRVIWRASRTRRCSRWSRRSDDDALGRALRPLRPRRLRARAADPAATRRSRRTPCRRPSSASGATADRFLAERAKASTWILTLVHRRAVDLVRREDVRRGEPLEPRTRARGAERPPRTRPRSASSAQVVQEALCAAAGRAARGARARLLRRPHAVASSPSGSASRSARSRAGCSPASRGLREPARPGRARRLVPVR